MNGRVKRFLSSIFSAKQSRGYVHQTSTLCREETWTLYVVVQVPLHSTWPDGDVVVSGVAGTKTLRMDAPISSVLKFEGASPIDGLMGAGAENWGLVRQVPVQLKPGQSTFIELELARWTLRVNVKSFHPSKWPDQPVGIRVPKSFEDRQDAVLTSASKVLEFHGAKSVIDEVSVTAPLGWRGPVSGPNFSIAPGEQKSIDVWLRCPWRLTVRVKSKFNDLWPDAVSLSLPGRSARLRSMIGAVLEEEFTGDDPVNGELQAIAEGWSRVAPSFPRVVLNPGDRQTVEVELHCWRLKAEVEFTTAFGWPKDQVKFEFDDLSLPAKTLSMPLQDPKNVFKGDKHVIFHGGKDLRTKIKASAAGWTLEAPQDIDLKPGQDKTVKLKLKGVDVEFQLVGAEGKVIDEVKNQKVKLYREDGTTEVPGAPATTDANGKATLKNVPPETYKIKFPDLWDDEWELSKTEDL